MEKTGDLELRVLRLESSCFFGALILLFVQRKIGQPA